MIKKILVMRYTFLIVVFFMMLNSLFFIVGGVLESVHGIRIILEYGLDEEKRPGIKLLKALDLFLVSIVFMNLALGILKMFGFGSSAKGQSDVMVDIGAFRELKGLIWETILVTLVVFTLTFIASSKTLYWELLILPSVVVLLSLGLYIIRKH